MQSIALTEPHESWRVVTRGGPVIGTAVHAGHWVSDDLAPRYKLDSAGRRREEDPLTNVWAHTADNVFVTRMSRFEVDLNRSAGEAVYLEPDDAWGLHVWETRPDDAQVDRALRHHRAFYDFAATWLEELLQHNERLLLLDIHSYNHRRDGPDAAASAAEDNPDIDLGMTTLDHSRFGEVANALAEGLSQTAVQGRELDVRRNVRYPDGGHWPEWVYANYADRICTITLEYKKFYMDEWSGTADLDCVDEIAWNLKAAVDRARLVL
jgi:N-formylglutamate amidohydrolase